MKFSVVSHESHPLFLDLSVMWRRRHFSWLGLQYGWRGMPVKQHVQEIGGREEDEGGVCLGRSDCVELERGSWDIEQRSPSQVGHPREWTCSSFLFSIALGSRQEHSSRMSQDMGNGITWKGETETLNESLPLTLTKH